MAQKIKIITRNADGIESTENNASPINKFKAPKGDYDTVQYIMLKKHIERKKAREVALQAEAAAKNLSDLVRRPDHSYKGNNGNNGNN